jgi:hypothetical protein
MEQQGAACKCRPAGGHEPPSSGMAAAVISYEVAAVRASHATLLPPSAVHQAAQTSSGQRTAKGGSTGIRDVGTNFEKEPGSSGEEGGSAATATAACPAGSAAAPAGSATQAAGGTAAVRHIVTLKKGREWRFAAIWRGGGIAVWREDGTGLFKRSQTLRCKDPVPLLDHLLALAAMLQLVMP